MGIILAIGVAVYAFKVFHGLEWPWLVSVPICLLIVGVWFLPGLSGFTGIVLFCGAAILLGIVQKASS